VFLSTGYNSFNSIDGVELDHDFFFNPAGPLFKHPNMYRLANKDNLFSWEAFRESKVQGNFKNKTIDYIFERFLANECEDISHLFSKLFIDKDQNRSQDLLIDYFLNNNCEFLFSDTHVEH
jgi:hypothetical protein